MSIFKAAFEKIMKDRNPNGRELASQQDAERVAEALYSDLHQLKVPDIGLEQTGPNVLVSDGNNLLVVQALGGAMYALGEYEVAASGVPVQLESESDRASKAYKQHEMADEVIRWIGIERLEKLNGGEAGAPE